VLLDAQNTRLVKYSPSGHATVLYDFEPADFVPDAVAVIRETVVVVGMTNRPQRPYDVIALSLEDGELLERVETTVDINGDLRTTTDGVFWARASSHPQWLAIADSEGNLLEGAQQRTLAHLPGESTMDVAFDTGLEVTVQPAGDSPPSVFDVTDDTAQFVEVLGYRYSDGALVLLGAAFDERSVAPVTAVALGTDLDGQLAANAYEFTIERFAEVGAFNTFRYAFGGLYALNTMADGIEIVRYQLG
jgi:hypothetical protein